MFKSHLRTASAVAVIGLGMATFGALAQSRPAAQPAANTDLDFLLKERRYIRLEKALASDLKISAKDRAFFEGIMANRRNRAAESIRLLQPLVPALAKGDPSRAITALSTLADDYEKTFQYAAAADTYTNLVQNFASEMSAEQIAKSKREAARWDLLRNAPPQSANINGPFTIATAETRLGLVKAPVTIDGQQISLILDTGANLSAISRSMALRLGLNISANQATMEGVSAIPTPAHTAVIPKLEIGKAVFRNVAVIVVDDKDMFIAGLNYMLPGSLGFPVLSALGRITFFPDGQFGVALPPTADKPQKQNLFLQRLTPIVAAEIMGKEELFTIDTGATGSYLSARYYHDFPHQFDSQMVDQVMLTGAGGRRTLPVYDAPQVTLSLGGACVHLKNVPVLLAARGIGDDYFYGNLGQNAVRVSSSYTFDFQNMNFTIDAPACQDPG
jgi:clan AA aspartic protease (TIGR02281 family)